ncbi:uncharacterized protein VTP21DRAFT_10816 [Calcarisporiella thermophila]|uniref:uncharacterized protein n=1 Tax=Calcarisporiella thermophila TaxID=911321 RepID=UPI0037437358
MSIVLIHSHASVYDDADGERGRGRGDRAFFKKIYCATIDVCGPPPFEPVDFAKKLRLIAILPPWPQNGHVIRSSATADGGDCWFPARNCMAAAGMNTARVLRKPTKTRRQIWKPSQIADIQGLFPSNILNQWGVGYYFKIENRSYFPGHVPPPCFALAFCIHLHSSPRHPIHLALHPLMALSLISRHIIPKHPCVRCASVLHSVDPESVASPFQELLRQRVHQPPPSPATSTATPAPSSINAASASLPPSPPSPQPVASQPSPPTLHKAKLTLTELTRVLETSKELVAFLRKQVESSQHDAGGKEMTRHEIEEMLKRCREDIVRELVKELRKK